MILHSFDDVGLFRSNTARFLIVVLPRSGKNLEIGTRLNRARSTRRIIPAFSRAERTKSFG